jgi:hypothetical protein
MKIALALIVALSVGLSSPAGAQPTPTFRVQIDAYRRAHEPEILREFAALLAIPNLAGDSANIRRNAAVVRAMLERRGATTQLLESPSGEWRRAEPRP